MRRKAEEEILKHEQSQMQKYPLSKGIEVGNRLYRESQDRRRRKIAQQVSHKLKMEAKST